MSLKHTIGFSPYPGLRSFHYKEAHIFFGRAPQTQHVLTKLAEHRFVAVLGPSGGGKSSLVRAGVIAALKRATDAPTDEATWWVGQMRPGAPLIATPTPSLVPVKLRQTLLKHERFYLQRGETVEFALEFDKPAEQAVTLTCASLKGTISCVAPAEQQTAAQQIVRYTAPEAAGKDLLDLKFVVPETGESGQTLIKIEILAE